MMKDKSEQILSFTENELIDKESIRRTVLSEKPIKQKKTVVWTKVLLPIAACFVLLCGTVLAIPSARAEVFSWFGISTPQDYLTADPSERPDVPELNALIASPDANAEVVTIPVAHTESDAIDSETAQRLSSFLHENSDIALGEAMYTGDSIYQTIRLNGLSGLHLLEQYTGSHTMAVSVDSEYEWPNSRIVYEMPDGTRYYGMIDLTSSIDSYTKTLIDQGLYGNDAPANAQEKIDDLNRQYLEKNGLMAVAEVSPHDFEKYLDADGNLTAKVFYTVSLVAEDESGVSKTELYDAQIGTITVNMKAYQNIETNGLEADGASVVWGAETVTISKRYCNFCVDGSDKDQLVFFKYRISMEGVKMTAETEDAEIDTLGIRKVGIRITVPDSWSDSQKEALAASLEFHVLLNGESGEWYPQYVYCEVEEDGSILWMADEIYGVPYDLLKTVKTISFIPEIRETEKVEEYDSDWNYLNTIEPAYGEITYGILGAEAWRTETEPIEFPQCALTLNVN